MSLLAYQTRSGADVVLGLFPADRPSTMDVVDVGNEGVARRILVKPACADLTHTWGIAVWTTAFTEFLHDQLKQKTASSEGMELHVGNVI